MTTDRLDEIKKIQKAIISDLEKGEDVSDLSRQLARVRAEIAADAEVQELKKVAEQRQALRGRATAVQEQGKKQSEVADRFLQLRDALVSQLQPLLEPLKELARMQSPSYSRELGEFIFDDIGQFVNAVKGIPLSYLPANFGCPFLEMSDGTQKADGKASEAYAYLQWCCGILAGLKKGFSALPLKPADNPLVEVVYPESDDAPETSCLVCNHEKAAEINKALQDGQRSLRELETYFNVSRSTLSRHKNRCLNLGAVRFTD